MKEVQRYFGKEIRESDIDSGIIGMMQQKMYHDIPVAFVYARDVLMVEFLISGLRVFSVVAETMSLAFAGGIGIDEVSIDMIIHSVWFLQNVGTRTQYMGALRRYKQVKVIGTTDGVDEDNGLCSVARAIRYGRYECQVVTPVVTEGNTMGLVLKTMIQDGRPVIFYCRHEYGKLYQNAMEHYGIVGAVVPTEQMGYFSDIYLNICGISFPFLSQAEKILCVEKKIPTLDGSVGSGLRVGLDNGLAARGQLARLDDYRTTMQVTEIERFNCLAIERIIKVEKPKALCFPGDGNGVGYKLALEHGIPCVSGDLYPRHPGVVSEDWRKTVERSSPEALVVFSRLLQFIEYDETVLAGRKSINVDRHHVKGWLRGLDSLISANSPVEMLAEKIQDRNTPLPLAELPHFINFFRKHYNVDLADAQLESVCRFVKLHSWKVTMRVPDNQKKILAMYGIAYEDKMDNYIADSPLAELDYYTGILPEKRQFVDGLPRRMAVHEVAVVRDKIVEPTQGVFHDGVYYYLRFKEPGWYQIKFIKPVSRKNKIISSTVVIEVVRNEGSTDMIFGSGNRESYQVVTQEGTQRLISVRVNRYVPPEYVTTSVSMALVNSGPSRSNQQPRNNEIELDQILDE
jgi:hypothetical protein